MTNKKLLLFKIFLLCAITRSYAQQDAMYTQYMFNTLAINPAYAGSRNVLSVTGLFRSQWVGVDGAPETQTLSFDTAIPDKRVGIGFQAFNDKIGITKTTGAFATYAYRIRMETSTLAFGIQGGVTNFRANFADVQLNTGSIPDVAFSQNVNTFLPNFGTGVYFNSDKFYVGLSAPHLLNNTLTNNSTIVTNGLISKQYLHLFLASGYVFDIGQDFKLKPSFLLKGVRGAPIELDVNANFWIKDVIAVGGQYRSNADVSAMFEAQVSPQIRIGYSYDRSVTRLVNYNSGSHELMLRYEFGFENDRILAPRYF